MGNYYHYQGVKQTTNIHSISTVAENNGDR